MRSYSITLAMLIVLVLACPSRSFAQGLGGSSSVMRSSIADQRVQRQTEVIRLERLIEDLDSRVIRLERQQLRSARLPAITIAEAEATVEFAKEQLKESEYHFERGEASKVDVARDRLALARAQGQFDSAMAAHEETLLALEMDVIYAERQLFEFRRERELTEKLAAKGYTSTDALQRLFLNEKLAEKELQTAKLRLQTQRKSAGQENASVPPTNDLTPDEDSDVPATPETRQAE